MADLKMLKKEELKNQFLKRIENNQSIKYSIMKKEDSLLVHRIEKAFGNLTNCALECDISIEELINKYGYSKKIIGGTLDEEEILKRLLYLKNKNKLSTSAMRTEFEDNRLENSIKKIYGSVDNGLSYFKLERTKKKKTLKIVLQEVQKLVDSNVDLSYKNMQKNHNKVLFDSRNKTGLSWYEFLDKYNFEYEYIKINKHTRETIQKKLNQLLLEHKNVNYSIIKKFDSGIFSYARNKYNGVEEFLEDFGFDIDECCDRNSQKYKGLKFEKIFKQILELKNIEFIHNKQIHGTRLRPDFLIKDKIIDCKLSAWTKTIESTIDKYKNYCNEIEIVYLRGSKKQLPEIKNVNVKFTHVNEYLNTLSQSDRHYFEEELKKIKL